MKVLWLASWYPTKLSPFNGDFIQRHAQAVSIFAQVNVIHVVKDEAGTITNDIKIEINAKGNLQETIIYYRSARTGNKILDKFLSHQKYKKIYRQQIADHFLQNGKADIVHVNVAMKAGLIALWIKKNFKIPFVLTEHWTGYYKEWEPNIFDEHIFFQKMTKIVLLGSALFLPVTADLGSVINNDLIKVKYEVVPNVVNTELFYWQQKKGRSRFKFIHPSSLNFQKNPEGIIAACKILKESKIDFELQFIGNEDKDLIALANVLGLSEQISFIGMISYEEVALQMQQADSLLLFSRFENLPCVVLEALCCGVPVISSRVGGISEVINDSNGLLVENENIQQLADAMKNMISNYNIYDNEMISKKATTLYSYHSIGNEYFEKYKNISLIK